MKRLIAVLAVSGLAACGSTPSDANGDGIADNDPLTPDSVTAVAPSTPKGKVSGQVVDSQGRALEGVEVRMSGIESATATTDSNGLFAFEKVTGNSRVGLLFSKEGFAPAYTTATVPGAAGNFPLNDGEIFIGQIGLIPSNGSMTFHIVGYDGALVTAFEGALDVTPGFLSLSNSASGMGSITANASGADGAITFAGVPSAEVMARLRSVGISGRYSLYIAPVMNGDSLRYAGKFVTFNADELLTAPWTRTIVLDAPYSDSDLEIVATNVPNLVERSLARYNLVSPSGPLYVAFNQRVAPTAIAQVYVDRQDSADYAPVVAGVEVSNIGNQLRIMPNQKLDNAFRDGQKYFLELQVTSRDTPAGGPVRVVAPFFGGNQGDAKPLGSVTVQFLDTEVNPNVLDPGEQIEIIFERNIGRGEASGFSVPVYLNYDLDGSGTIGDSAGEINSGEPFCVRDAETVPSISGATKSGYSRWAAAPTVSSPRPNSISIPYLGIPNAADVDVMVALSEGYKCSGILHTVWGDNLLADVQVKLTAKPAPAN